MHIPGYKARDPRTAPLRRAIKTAADRMGVTREAMTTAMLEFLECLTDEVAEGNIFTIPGFGRFMPVSRMIKNGSRAYRPKVFFRAAHQFGLYVAQTCPVSKAMSNDEYLDNYVRVNNIGDPNKNTKRHKTTTHQGFAKWKAYLRNSAPSPRFLQL